MTMTSSENSNQSSHTTFRFLQGLLPIHKAQVGPDLIAGITLAALGIPVVMGYTKIVGTPVITGLYTLFLPGIVFALLGSSRHLVVSADSATAAMVAAGLTSLSFTAYTPRYTELAGLIGIVAGAILLLARILRLGFLSDFLSRTVLVGFLTGVGVQVAVGELHDLLGIEKQGHGFLRQTLFTLQHLRDTHLPTLFIAAAVVAVIFIFDIFAPRFPGALLAVIGMTAASAHFNWAGRGIRVVGTVPSGVPHIALPHLTYADVLTVLPISFSCFIVILAQSAATSRAYALKYRESLNQNVDLIGLAAANAAAACSGTFIVNGSPTQSAMVDTAGGRSQLSQLTTAAVVLLVLLFLTHPLGFLPNAVLAAIVFLIGVKLIDFRGLAQIQKAAPREFALAVITAATVVLFGVEQGIILAVVLSLLQHVRHSYRPPTAVIIRDATKHWDYVDARPGQMIEPGLIMYWFGADLFYANVAFFAAEARMLVEDSPTPIRWFAVDATAITDVDFSAGKGLAELQQDLAKSGITLALIVHKVRHENKLEQLGLISLIGSDLIFESRHKCVKAYLAATEKP